MNEFDQDRIQLPLDPPYSKFRLYVTEKWYEHKEELLNWTGQFPEYDSNYYFNKHRWLLKKMFKDQKSK